MGYAVYEDREARTYGVLRWAGYGVPAICDIPSCESQIDRGISYKCEEHVEYTFDEDTEDESEFVGEGCGLYFCGVHESASEHAGVTPKPDTAEWIEHILTDESWQEWRDGNPERVKALGRTS